MKIAVCGSNTVSDEKTARKAFEIGEEIAKNNILLLTGAGNGYPHEAAKGAFSVDGRIFGVSPAKNEDEHMNIYKFPKDMFTKIEYTGLGIPGRNLPLVMEADAIIIVSGQIGSLNEFTIAFYLGKIISVLKGSGGITELIEEIADICNRNKEKYNVIYSSDPKELVSAAIRKYNEEKE